jgi:8-oxo-dGTP pyrophosphatase MutT (NUDIX family)
MTPEQFSSRFCLTLPTNKELSNKSLNTSPSTSRYVANSTTKNAAVLVPIIKRPNGLTLLFTKRSQNMRHHPGEVSFPGGKQDLEDTSLTYTALRETFEEVGIHHNQINTLGWLPSFQTISNFKLYPLVGLIENIDELTLNPDEVESAFEVPLRHFIERQNHQKIESTFNNVKHPIHFMPYQDKLIWGVTAAIIDQLILHFE